MCFFAWGLIFVTVLLAACEINSSSEADGNDNRGVSSSSTQTVSYGEVTDTRDGQTYKTVVIGSQTWMAENLNYAVDSSWCYEDNADSCSQYGRLYSWVGAMSVSMNYNVAILGDSVDHQGACPSGWHIPSNGEWATLEAAVGGFSTAGTALKSKDGWYDSGNGTDTYGFSALPAGRRDGTDGFYDVDSGAYFWSATENDAYNAYNKYLDNGNAEISTYDLNKSYAFSIRCVKDISDGSSLAESSSSSTQTVSYGEVTDTRDGQTYKTVAIGTQTWMAENLNYAVDSSWCYEDNADNCSQYGRLYLWVGAMSVSMNYNIAILGDSVNHQGACPSGWHIPSNGEWATLEAAVGGFSTAGTALKSNDGWYDSGNGTDAYGFSALPAGRRHDDGSFHNTGLSTDFWSARENNADSAYSRHLDYNDTYMSTLYYNKSSALYVRCVMD